VRILLSNDDGYFAPGLAVLAESLAGLGQVTVVAPERDRSGASNSLTLDRPLSVRRSANGFLFVDGTPTDCVHLAVTGFLEEPPDIVVSGINLGANMGDDTIYSGTVAVSLTSKEGRHYETAARIARDVVERLARRTASGPVLLNVNVPDLPFDTLKGIEVTRLGRRHKAEGVVKVQNPRGLTMYWIGAAGEAQDAGPGTDFFAVAADRVSVTPLQMDLTHQSQIPFVKELLG
jgi:5'-nucleotidase